MKRRRDGAPGAAVRGAVRRWGPAVLLSAAFSAAVTAQDVPAPAEFSEVRADVMERVANGESPSLALAVVREDRVIWAEGFGLADREARRESNADTLYLLASVSKPMLATGLMTLVDQELIDLDQPANTYLPGVKLRAYRGDAEQITVRRLADHTAGLAEHWSFFYGADEPPPFEITLERYGFAHRVPGTGWEYSNLAFGTLNYIVQSVANEEWGEYLWNNVFEPAGMLGTGAQPRDESRASAQYFRDVSGRFVRIPRYDFDHPGASALWSSARDLARFARLHIGAGSLDGEEVISSASARAMRTRTAQLAGGGRNGVGWFVGERYGRALLFHGGGMPGVSTLVHAYPDDRAAVIVLTNSSGHALTRHVEERIGRQLFGAAPETASADPGPDAPPVPRSASYAGEWTGRLAHFRGDVPLVLDVDESGSGATIRFASGAQRAMEELSCGPGGLRGAVRGRIEAHESYQGEARLSFRLRMEDEHTLCGVCVAVASSYAARPFWVELQRPGGGAEVQLSFFTRPDAPTVGYVLPEGWEDHGSTSSMRLTQFELPSKLECVVYFFGVGGGGGVQANLDRWIAQFEVEGEPKKEEHKLTGRCTAHRLDVTGTYVAAIRPGADQRNRQDDWRLLAAILEVPGGPLFVKMVGPAEDVAGAAGDFDAWIRSFTEVD